jgi:VTC domain-containing protein
VIGELRDLLGRFDPVSLESLDERAALLKRVDNKYALTRNEFVTLMDALHDSHQALDIDGRRSFAYCTTYFETPDLRCFIDHVENRTPRFKARSRLYEDTGLCVFEVKLKRSEGETDKRQTKYDEQDRRQLTAAARNCLEEALADAGLTPPEEMTASLTTAFDRVTLAAAGGSERLTCDLGTRLVSSGGATARMRDDLVLVETKSQSGRSPADRQLQEMEIDVISLSKYRVGMSLVGAATGYAEQPGGHLFVID